MGRTYLDNLRSELELSERKRIHLQRQGLIKPSEDQDISLWVMLDLMTLILVFFIILYSDLLPATVPRSAEILLKPVLLTKKPVRIEEETTHNSIHQNNQELLSIKKNFQKAMLGTNDSDYSIEIHSNRVVMTINEKISFPVAKAELADEIKDPLKRIARFLNRSYVHRIIVSGHTDNTPIHTQKFPSNWELSVARAMSVAKFLMKQDVDPTSISVEGFGQYNPVADNETHEGRQANRRV